MNWETNYDKILIRGENASAQNKENNNEIDSKQSETGQRKEMNVYIQISVANLKIHKILNSKCKLTNWENEIARVFTRTQME